MTQDPGDYEAWYHTPRGTWIGRTESSLLLDLMRPLHGQSLLDVGAGTGYFSRCFSEAGLKVTGIDQDPAMVHYARTQTDAVDYIEGSADQLPFEDGNFDFTAAITSLCFVTEPQTALAEMWRVSRHGIILGLLNRNSLLYLNKYNSGAYRDARWDTWSTVRQWITQLKPQAISHRHKTAIFISSGTGFARLAENLLHGTIPWGGFLVVYVVKCT